MVSRRLDLGRHRPGLQRVHADAARARDRDRSPTTASRITPHLVQDRSQNVQDRRGARRSRREPTHTLAVKPEHLAVIKNALVGVNKEGTSAAAFAGAQYVSGGKTGTAQVYSLKGEKYTRAQGRRAAARPRVVHRVRAGRQAEDRARGAGRERRLRRAGGGADRAPGARLLPARQTERRAPAPVGARRRRRERLTRATDGAWAASSAALWEVLTRRIDRLPVRRARWRSSASGSSRCSRRPTRASRASRARR